MRFIDYVEKLKLEARKKNILVVREEIDKAWVKTKINTFITAWDGMWSAEEVKEQILTNDIVAVKFAKDPGRQNIGEVAVNNLLGADKKLGVNQVRFNEHGEKISGPQQVGCSKSADYFWMMEFIILKNLLLVQEELKTLPIMTLLSSLKG